MKAIIVYDSYFGNTNKVSEIIKENLKGDAEMINVSDLENSILKNIDLLIVGSPTRAFNATKKINDFIKNLGDLKKLKVAVFDTRMDIKKINNKFLTFMANIFGYAKEKIEKKLKKKNAEIITESEGFFVDTEKGPLSKGEEQRIKKWINEIKL